MPHIVLHLAVTTVLSVAGALVPVLAWVLFSQCSQSESRVALFSVGSIP